METLMRKRSSFINKLVLRVESGYEEVHSTSPDSITKIYKDEKIYNFNNLNNGLCYKCQCANRWIL